MLSNECVSRLAGSISCPLFSAVGLTLVLKKSRICLTDATELDTDTTVIRYVAGPANLNGPDPSGGIPADEELC